MISNTTGTMSPLEADAALELMNVSVGRACASLSAMTGCTVNLSIPELAFNFFDTEYLTDLSVCSAVSQRFHGDMNGVTLLFFPGDMAESLVEGFIGAQLNVSDDIDREELELDALLEIGNIILNACIGSMVNQLDCNLITEMPKYFKGDAKSLVTEAGLSGQYTMMLKTLIEIEDLNINGYLTMVLDADSAEKFQQLIAAYLQVWIKHQH